MAHTLVYEATILGDGSLPTEVAGKLTTPTLVVAGSASMPFMPVSARALASALPNGAVRILQGQSHDIDAAVLGPVLEAFLKGN
jgi:pimeloyl-ACP methyl ester carboxylesterase